MSTTVNGTGVDENSGTGVNDNNNRTGDSSRYQSAEEREKHLRVQMKEDAYRRKQERREEKERERRDRKQLKEEKRKMKGPFFRKFIPVALETVQLIVISSVTMKVIDVYSEMDDLVGFNLINPDISVSDILAFFVALIMVTVPVLTFRSILQTNVFEDPEDFFFETSNRIRAAFWVIALLFILGLEVYNFAAAARLEAMQDSCTQGSRYCSQIDIDNAKIVAQERIRNALLFGCGFASLNLFLGWLTAKFVFSPTKQGD